MPRQTISATMPPPIANTSSAEQIGNNQASGGGRARAVSAPPVFEPAPRMTGSSDKLERRASRNHSAGDPGSNSQVSQKAASGTAGVRSGRPSVLENSSKSVTPSTTTSITDAQPMEPSAISAVSVQAPMSGDNDPVMLALSTPERQASHTVASTQQLAPLEKPQQPAAPLSAAPTSKADVATPSLRAQLAERHETELDGVARNGLFRQHRKEDAPAGRVISVGPKTMQAMQKLALTLARTEVRQDASMDKLAEVSPQATEHYAAAARKQAVAIYDQIVSDFRTEHGREPTDAEFADELENVNLKVSSFRDGLIEAQKHQDARQPATATVDPATTATTRETAKQWAAYKSYLHGEPAKTIIQGFFERDRQAVPLADEIQDKALAIAEKFVQRIAPGLDDVALHARFPTILTDALNIATELCVAGA